LFAQRGFHGVSTKEIAAAARVSEALIFKHFPSKRKLYRGLYAYCTRTFELDAERVSALPVETASAARLLYFVLRSVLVKRSAEAPSTFRLFCHSCLDDGEFAALLLDGIPTRTIVAKFEKCLSAGIKCGEIAKVSESPVRLFWLVRNSASQIYLHQLPKRSLVSYEVDSLTLVREAFNFGLRGLGFNDVALRRYTSQASLQSWETDNALSLLVHPAKS
jgi:AcrR family transcriptional regulator